MSRLFSMNQRFVYFLVACSAGTALLTVSIARAASSTSADSVAAPCATAANSAQPFRACSRVTDEIITKLDERVREHVVGLYQGKSIDPTDSNSQCSSEGDNVEGTCSTGGTNSFVKPVCSVSANPFNQNKKEITDNHLSESCGPRIQIHVSSGASTITYDLRGDKGTREIAYYGGAYVQALSCYLEQVKKEVLNSNSILKVSASCKNMAADLAGLSGTYSTITKAVNDKLSGDLKAQVNAKDIWNCEKQWSDTKKPKDEGPADIGPLRQSAQHLCASRAALETLFNQLLVCEVFARASNDFLTTFGDLDAFREKIDKKVGVGCNKECNSKCKSQCTSKCKKYAKKGKVSKAKSCAKSCAGSCGTSCGNTCYERELVPFLQDQQKKWPNDGSCPL